MRSSRRGDTEDGPRLRGEVGGPTRTDDLLLGKEMLYQLSYSHELTGKLGAGQPQARALFVALIPLVAPLRDESVTVWNLPHQPTRRLGVRERTPWYKTPDRDHGIFLASESVLRLEQGFSVTSSSFWANRSS